MSADNWAICPRCLSKATAEHLTDCERVHALYGQIPSEGWRAQLAALEAVDPEKFRTFREDYEIYGAEQGEVEAHYKGHCEVCDLDCRFDYSKRFWGADA